MFFESSDFFLQNQVSLLVVSLLIHSYYRQEIKLQLIIPKQISTVLLPISLKTFNLLSLGNSPECLTLCGQCLPFSVSPLLPFCVLCASHTLLPNVACILRPCPSLSLEYAPLPLVFLAISFLDLSLNVGISEKSVLPP